MLVHLIGSIGDGRFKFIRILCSSHTSIISIVLLVNCIFISPNSAKFLVHALFCSLGIDLISGESTSHEDPEETKGHNSLPKQNLAVPEYEEHPGVCDHAEDRSDGEDAEIANFFDTAGSIVLNEISFSAGRIIFYRDCSNRNA